MENTPQARLAAALRALEQQFGAQAIVRARSLLPRVSGIPTGFDALDTLGCVPLGHISELVAWPTAGATTLALCLLSQAQRDGSLAAYIDLARCLDPHAAARRVVDLSRLWIVQPQNGREVLDFAEALALSGLRLVVLDSTALLLDDTLGPAALHSGLRRLVSSLNGRPCAILFLSLLTTTRGGVRPSTQLPPPTLIEDHTAFRLWLQCEHWLTQFGTLRGYGVRVTVLRGGQARAPCSACFNILLDE